MPTQKIMEVTDVNFQINKSKPPVWVITATGNARSNKHINPRLELRLDIMDGFINYDFLVDVVDEPGPDVITERKAYAFVADPSSDLKGIRVYAETNQIEITVSKLVAVSPTDYGKNILKNLKAKAINGTVGPLILVTCELNAGDFPTAVELVKATPQGFNPAQLLLVAENAVDSNNPNWIKEEYSENTESIDQYHDVSVWHHGTLLDIKRTEKP